MTSAGLPRFFDVVLSAVVLLVATPLLLLAALAIKLESAGPICFRQARVGRHGRTFTLIKLRTMRTRAKAGTARLRAETNTAITASGDQRVTRVGRWLRRSKIDELPELWNVLRGDMALVGPRPEVSAWVDLADPRWQKILVARPGLTDPVTLRLRNEESLLAQVAGDHELFYREILQPWKLQGYAAYLAGRTPLGDLRVLAATFWAILRPASTPPPSLAELTQGLPSARR